jgi:hypothetical protein
MRHGAEAYRNETRTIHRDERGASPQDCRQSLLRLETVRRSGRIPADSRHRLVVLYKDSRTP